MIGNFKNIAKTVAQCHQRYMCYVLSNPSDYLKSEQVLGPVVSLHISSLEYEAEVIAACPAVSTNSTIQSYDTVLCELVRSYVHAPSSIVREALHGHVVI